MPAKDIYHDDVCIALRKDAWTITDDPLRLRWGKKDYYVDLGAEQVIAAEKPGQRIAVEIKSFLAPSMVDDMEKALGQYLIYRSILRRRQPDRELYLAVPNISVTWSRREPDRPGRFPGWALSCCCPARTLVSACYRHWPRIY